MAMVALVPEAKRSGSLALPYVGLLDPLEQSRSDGTALAGILHVQDTSVRVAAAADQFGQVVQPTLHADVAGRVDHGFDAPGPAFLEVLLDP
jgi:hypothetical protein